MLRFLKELFFRPRTPLIESHDGFIDKLTTGRTVLCERELPDDWQPYGKDRGGR